MRNCDSFDKQQSTSQLPAAYSNTTTTTTTTVTTTVTTTSCDDNVSVAAHIVNHISECTPLYSPTNQYPEVRPAFNTLNFNISVSIVIDSVALLFY